MNTNEYFRNCSVSLSNALNINSYNTCTKALWDTEKLLRVQRVLQAKSLRTTVVVVLNIPISSNCQGLYFRGLMELIWSSFLSACAINVTLLSKSVSFRNINYISLLEFFKIKFANLLFKMQKLYGYSKNKKVTVWNP